MLQNFLNANKQPCSSTTQYDFPSPPALTTSRCVHLHHRIPSTQVSNSCSFDCIASILPELVLAILPASSSQFPIPSTAVPELVLAILPPILSPPNTINCRSRTGPGDPSSFILSAPNTIICRPRTGTGYPCFSLDSQYH